MALLGEEGRGYELARKLESCGVWRTWLGDSTYAAFSQFLSSPASWDSFMSNKSRAHLFLQLRVRALLFDKASSAPSPSLSLHSLNPSYLQLHPDDVYFTLEDASQDGLHAPTTSTTASKNQSKTASGAGSRYADSDMDGMSQKYRNEELPETWYNQFLDKYKANKKLVLGDRESPKRSPVEMASYITYISNHKKRRRPFKEDQHTGFDNSIAEKPNGGNLNDDDPVVFPEIMYAWNCVPDSALTPTSRVEYNPKVKFFGVLDTLPPVTTRSPVMIERLGIRPEYLNMEQGGGMYRGKSGPEGNSKLVGPDQASKLSQKVVARALAGVGFEASMERPIAVFAEALGNHIYQFGERLKLLADSYRKQCSAIELLKMVLKIEGITNFAPLVEVVKDSSKNIVQQSQQQVHGIQSQMHPQHQSFMRLPQQVQAQRQIHPQMQQIIHSQNMAFQQQQQQQIRRRAVPTPRPGMDIDKERPLVQVKLENPPDLPIDNAFNSRHPQMQFRQQQMAAMSGFHSQSGNQFRQMGSLQIPQMQSQNMGMVRAPPVKVEGFQELMGGDSASRHDSEENRLTSPSGK